MTPLNNLREGERLTVSDSGAVVIVTGEGSHIGVTPANAAYQDDSLFNVIGRRVHIIYFGGLWLLAIAGALVEPARVAGGESAFLCADQSDINVSALSPIDALSFAD